MLLLVLNAKTYDHENINDHLDHPAYSAFWL